MIKRNKTFRKLRSLIIVRNLFLLLFKISISVISIMLISIVALIIILSTKPRVIPFVNKYLISMVEKIDNNIKFNKFNATLHFDENLGLEYRIKDSLLELNDNKFKISNFIINVNFTDLFFGKININSITSSDNIFEINLKDEKKKKTEYNISNIQTNISKFFKKPILINKIVLKNLKIITNLNNKKSNIEILDFKLTFKKEEKINTINQDIIFNVNKNKLNSKITLKCEKEKSINECDLDIYNINSNSYTTFFKDKTDIYEYLKNIKAYFNIFLKFNLNKDFDILNGKFYILSPVGSFYLKDFFDERISFTKMIINGNFDNNLNKLNIESLTANLDETEFMMSLILNKYTKYKNLDLYFNVKKIPLTKLKKLWPNFLGQKEGIRPWVIKHITSGTSPEATAKINLKYFDSKDEKHISGLQEVYSEVKLDNVFLNYNNYFPEVININGLAIFTKNNMTINIDSAKVLDSKINNSSVYMNFLPKTKKLIIKANTKGPFSDLFTHINKKDRKIIENSVNSVIEDYYTNSNLKITIPIIDNINFNKSGIIAKSKLRNKKNSILKNTSNISLSFIKLENTDNFYGNIDLTESDIEYLPLNIYKPAKKKLSFNYKAILKDDIVQIKEFNPLVDYIKFKLDGFIDIKNKKQEVNIKNIEYNKSKYSIKYKSYTENEKLYNCINIDGENINYDNIVEKLKKIKITKSQNKKINNQTIITLNLKSLDFGGDKKLLKPSLFSQFDNNILTFITFNANMNKGKYVKLSLDKKNIMFNLKSNDFGKLFSTINLTNSMTGGEGEINVNQKNINGKNIIIGNLKLNKKFSILPNEEIKKDVLSDVDKDKNFKKLNKSLNKNSKITFDKLEGEFEYENDTVRFREVIANSRFINLQILASGYVNIKKQEIKVEGLLVPVGFINGLFGINKLPLISDIIFGQKDGGLFASKFTLTKKDKNDSVKININKFSMILPGFLRNIFDINTYIKK